MKNKDIVLLDFEKPISDIKKKIEEFKKIADEGNVDLTAEISALEEKSKNLLFEIYKNLTPWQTTLVARHPQRPLFLDYVNMMFEDFMEIHGDRNFGDDKAVVCGIAYLDDEKVVVIGQEKGKDIKEKIYRNFAMMRPEGYRKALRVMRLASKYKIPIATFIDTPGAYPGIDAEERGQGEAIARNLREMFNIEAPIIAVVIGEGGSGGALGIGVADRVYMLENSIYSVISPEGCASILWRDSTKASEAAAALRLTAKDLLELKVIDGIIKEGVGGAHRNPEIAANNIKSQLLEAIRDLKGMSAPRLLEKRYNKFKGMVYYNKTM